MKPQVNKRAIQTLCLCLSIVSIDALAQSAASGGVYQCARLPSFIKAKGLSQPVAIDTSITRLPGLVIRELVGKKRLYQHESWRQTGHVGSTVRDRHGNIYVISIPGVALDTNPLERRNKVYKVDANTGEMQLFVDLPLSESGTQQNPFGTLGLALDCETESLYVSTVAGSTPQETLGKIYQISLKTGGIVDEYSGVDSIGLGIFKHQKQKRLYFGDARSSNVYSIPLSDRGAFRRTVKPEYEVSLLGIKNGDSTQVRKIRFSVGGDGGLQMALDETEFSYRMAAETARRYRKYTFKLDRVTAQWSLLSIQP